jgi:hypothetical protein
MQMTTQPMKKGDHNQRQTNPLVFWLVLAVALLPVCYVLLSGPAVWAFQHGYGRNVLPMIYKPMIWLEQSNTALGRLLAWYWSLWKG